MALNESRLWLIAYDIAQPRRLGRVHRYIKRVATPVQYSVYVAQETAQGIRRISEELSARIDPREDDVRIYPIPERTRIIHYGRRPLPDGLLLVQSGAGAKAWEVVTP